MYDYKFCWYCNKWKTEIDFNLDIDKSNCIKCYNLINKNNYKIIKKRKYNRLIDDELIKTLHLE